jgi:leader peptidase (prepilin peptidase)/N-methyltransferase
MLALYGFYFVLALIYPRGMGFGDVKLAGVLGLYLGWLGWAEVVAGAFLGFLFGGVVGGVLLLVRRAGRKSMIPFGPFMLAGALVAIIWGGALADLYLDTVLV